MTEVNGIENDTSQNLESDFKLDGCKVLIVEDSQSNLELLRFSLTKKKLIVEVACNGQEAIDQIKAVSPDIVLMDIDLPDQSGLDVCQIVKKIEDYAGLPIIFITGRNDSTTLLKAFEVGGADYIIKPLKLPEIIARLKTHLKISHLIKREKTFNEALKDANEEINKLLGIATHDLRNPLISIRGLTEFLRDGSVGPVTDSQKELIESIYGASEKLLFLIENLLDYSSVESSTVSIRRAPTNLKEIIESAIKLHSMTANKKEIALKFNAVGYDQELNIDKNRIEQVVDNLITNAIKFSPFKTEVNIVLEQDEKITTVRVIDQGSGIPEKEMGKLFKAFGQTSVRPTNNEQSTGLGLVICRKIIESHHGTITAKNNPSGGAEFNFTLKTE